MPYANANGIEIHYEESGEGEPLVLVHGSWSDCGNWASVAPPLAESFRVIAYDRRGHGRSERPAVQGTRRDQEGDLEGLIEALGIGPAHVVATSFGGIVGLGLAARRSDLVRTLTLHEPPMASLVAGDPRYEGLLSAIADSIDGVLSCIENGDHEASARRFVDEVALGPGAWEMIPQPMREVMVDSAPTFAKEMTDPQWDAIDAAELGGIAVPVTVTQGDASPEWFFGIVAALVDAIPGARVHTYRGAGHAPHITHPEDHVRAVNGFLLDAHAPALAR